MDSLVRDAFHRLVTLAELASISVAHRVRERFDSRRPFTRRFRFGLVRPGCSQPQPKAPAPDRRRQPTSATVKEHGHTDWTARSSLQNPLFRRILLSRGTGLRAARPPELTLRSPEGKAATGRQGSESACTTERAEAHSQRTCQALAVVRRAFPRDLVVPKQLAANLGPDRSAARTVRTFTRPKCFQPPGTLAGADPRRPFASGNATRRERAVTIHAFCATPLRLVSTDGPAKSSGDEQRPRLVGHQPEP